MTWLYTYPFNWIHTPWCYLTYSEQTEADELVFRKKNKFQWQLIISFLFRVLSSSVFGLLVLQRSSYLQQLLQNEFLKESPNSILANAYLEVKYEFSAIVKCHTQFSLKKSGCSTKKITKESSKRTKKENKKGNKQAGQTKNISLWK